MIKQSLVSAAAIVACCAVSAIPSCARATDDGPSAFVCRFEVGTSWGFEAGKFLSQPPAPLGFEITDINLEGQTAKLISDGTHTGALRIVRALNANHFLEVANEGFLNLTTVYDLDLTAKAYPAVHSRHFGLMGQPVFAQYAGLCTAK